jgi:hypothetical protein
MAERKRPPQQRRQSKSHAWIWWVLLIIIVGGVGYWAWPKYLRGRFGPGVAGEAAFISSLRTICTANVSYEYGHPKQGYAKTLADLGPKDGNFIDVALASGVKSGYRFEYIAKPGANGLIEQYRVTARPQERGGRSAFMDDSCEIHTTMEDRAATAADPKL